MEVNLARQMAFARRPETAITEGASKGGDENLQFIPGRQVPVIKAIVGAVGAGLGGTPYMAGLVDDGLGVGGTAPDDVIGGEGGRGGEEGRAVWATGVGDIGSNGALFVTGYVVGGGVLEMRFFGAASR
jgi:hypothetical protein